MPTSSKQLATFGQLLGVYTPERNTVNSDQFNAVARVGTVTPLTFEGTYSHQQLRYSADRFKYAQFSQDVGGLNLLWRSSALLTFGTGVRLIQGRYPQGPYGDDPFTGRGIDLSVNWTPSALSSLEGRIGYSRIRHEDVSQREFSGITGNLLWNWQPTGKIRLTTQLTRATGQDASFITFVGGSSTANSSLSQVTNTLAFFGRYAATARIGLEGNLRVAQRQLDRTVAAAAGTVVERQRQRHHPRARPDRPLRCDALAAAELQHRPRAAHHVDPRCRTPTVPATAAAAPSSPSFPDARARRRPSFLTAAWPPSCSPAPPATSPRTPGSRCSTPAMT